MLLNRLRQWLRLPTAPSRRSWKADEFHLDIEPLEERLAPQLSTTDLNQLTLQEVVSRMIGTGIEPFNIASQNRNISVGTFTEAGGSSILGCEDGVLISTGDINSVIGPNLGTNNNITVLGLPGDPDLNTFATSATLDATTLEFSFIPRGNVLTMRYVLGSEEYNQFVNLNIGDAFGIFVNGRNVAFVPGTSTQVSIDNINGGNPLGVGAQNPQLYRNNDVIPGPPTINTGLNGLTVVLTLVTPVIPNQVNTFKLAVGDTFGNTLDTDAIVCGNSTEVIKISTYCPFRYVCEGNGNFTGELTVVNNSDTDLPAPLFVILSGLPTGVTLLNTAGTTPSGNPFLQIPGNGLAAGTALKLPIIFTNPGNVPLDTELNCQFQVSSVLL